MIKHQASVARELDERYRKAMEQAVNSWFLDHPDQALPMSEVFKRTELELRSGAQAFEGWSGLSRENLVRSLLSLMDQRILKWDRNMRVLRVASSTEEPIAGDG